MRLALLSLCALGAGLGCAMPTESASEPQIEQATLIHVERRDASTQIAARYVRGSKLDNDALRATGGTVDLPELGQCTSFDGHTGGSIAPVELYAAGSTFVAQGEQSLELVPRSVPDVSDLVSGYVYSKSAELEPGAASAQLAGTEPVAFEIPADVERVELDGRGQPLELAQGESVALRWAQGASANAIVVVDLHAANGSSRCALEDTGSAELERGLFGNEGTLVVRRLARFEIEREAFARLLVFAESSRSYQYKAAR